MHFSSAILLASGLAIASAANTSPYRKASVARRADFPIPASQGSVTYDEPESITGEFDGGFKTYDRGVSCTGQSEGGDSDAVFILEDGATLKNVIIGANQIEGIHCQGSCTLENVWWEAVCEDAWTLKGDGDVVISGGGATGAEDKVLQMNGDGSLSVTGFTVVDFGKLFRSCGNCKGNGGKRTVTMDKITATSGKVLAGINSNYGDTATITNTCATDVKTICQEFEGTNDNDKEPEELGSGPSSACIYQEADVAVC